MDWITHPSGIRSRPLPDGWAMLDPAQGFAPPFSVDAGDHLTIDTVGVFPTIPEACRKANEVLRQRWQVDRFEITDQRCRRL